MSDFREPVTPDSFFVVRSDHACFGCGGSNPIELRLRFAADGDGVKALFVPGPDHQGFQDVVHGGIISAVLDEAMAWATARAGFWAVTGEMRVKFRQPLMIGDLTRVVARVTGTRGRLVMAAAELQLDRDGSPVATSSATFVKVGADVEAAWRARYLRDPDTEVTDGRADLQNAAEASAEGNGAGLSRDEAVANE